MQNRNPLHIFSLLVLLCLFVFSAVSVRAQQTRSEAQAKTIVEKETVAPEHSTNSPAEETSQGESLSTSAESTSGSPAFHGVDKTEETSSAGADQTSSKEEPAASSECPPGDRRWIIKIPRRVERKSPEKQDQILKTFIWENDEQRTKCSRYLQELRDVYLRTRYASIKGDSCATAVHAEETLKLMDQCRNECPPEYLERNGYSKRIERNVKLLQTAGKRRCLGYGAKPSATE